MTTKLINPRTGSSGKLRELRVSCRSYSQARVRDGDDHTVSRLPPLLHHPVELLVQDLPPV